MIDFTRINNDTNGNPRYVCHFLTFTTPLDDSDGIDGITRLYAIALKRSRQFGGHKFHNKQYGGGIVFQSYDIDALGEKIKAYVSTI